jgi:predicted Zn-dependent peptidase
MLFKGTRTLGTTDIERDLEVIAEQEALQEELRQHYRNQRARARRGEIDDPFDPEARTSEMMELEAKFAALIEEQRSLMVKDEFDQIYSEAGASGMNAFTTEDLTGYFITVPANKLELWFWMESDRLYEPVFREFYSERDVVHEERRMRTESTPTGKFDEMLGAMFWESHPYSWPVVGWPSDLRVISQQQAQDFFDTYYAPNNITGVLVGNFDLAEAKSLAKRYFGRLERGAIEPPDVVTLEMEQVAEKRMLAECDCQPQAGVQYHTVPFHHKDSYPLDVMAGILNGRTGRLYKSLVLDQKIATSAGASQDSRKFAGSFGVDIEAKGEATPEQLEAAWYSELSRLQNELVPVVELQKVKNQIAADAFRGLESPFFLLIQLVFYDGLGHWEYLNEWSDLTRAVTAEDVQRVAKAYFAPENRVVGLYQRRAGSVEEEMPEGFDEVPPEMQEMVKGQIRQIRQTESVEDLTGMVTMVEEQLGTMSSPQKEVMGVMLNAAKERLVELNEAGEEQ